LVNEFEEFTTASLFLGSLKALQTPLFFLSPSSRPLAFGLAPMEVSVAVNVLSNSASNIKEKAKPKSLALSSQGKGKGKEKLLSSGEDEDYYGLDDNDSEEETSEEVIVQKRKKKDKTKAKKSKGKEKDWEFQDEDEDEEESHEEDEDDLWQVESDNDTEQEQFTILTRSQLLEKQLSLVESIAGELGLPKWDAALLLQHFEYVYNFCVMKVLAYVLAISHKHKKGGVSISCTQSIGMILQECVEKQDLEPILQQKIRPLRTRKRCPQQRLLCPLLKQF
jgi:hypothetical protein